MYRHYIKLILVLKHSVQIWLKGSSRYENKTDVKILSLPFENIDIYMMHFKKIKSCLIFDLL